MRLWPSQRRPVVAAVPPADLAVTAELVRGAIEDVFAARQHGVGSAGVVFRGELRLPPARAVDTLQRRLRPFGFTPFLRAEGGDVVLQAVPVVEPVERPRARVNVLLFVLTCASTLAAGAFFSGSPTFDAFRGSLAGTFLVAGLPFAATLLAILGVHEFGHYFTARHYRASVSLPYFIPAPPPLFLFGTLGAIIRMRSPAPDRNSLFDIAAA
ncbi:MAG TPA: site-2 protease family protein, partial [Methylomirabilota bacterium]|nr:site-2 protease family protein [Methylomirabilota bacterium]